MVQIIEVEGADWLDEHRTCDRTAVRVIKVQCGAASGADLGAELTARRNVIGTLMDDLANQPHPIAITGSTWSQSDLFASPAVRVDTALDRAIWSLPPASLSPAFAGDASRFIFATGGAKLHEIMTFLDARGLSFRTAGSHKGQSIAGAIATGTHGSILGEMGLETHIRGLWFIAGTGASHWIADPDCPVFSDGFISGFAQAADPVLFNDAMIHLGALGYCAGVLIEAVPRFGLSWAKRTAPLPSGWWDAIGRGDFAAAANDLTGSEPPAFYELTFDPNAALDKDVMQTVYWRDALAPGYTANPAETEPDGPRDTLDLLADGINAFSKEMVASRRTQAGDHHGKEGDDGDRNGDGNGDSNGGANGNGLIENALGFLGISGPIRLLDIPEMIFDDFRASVAKQPCSNRPESLLALTSEWTPRNVMGIRIDTFNAAICVPLNQLHAALKVGTDIAPRFRKHFVYTVRFASRSKASMSFLRFDQCAIINIDGLTRAGIAGWISHSDEAALAFTAALEQAGVPFSMHWGKDIPSDASKIEADFGPAKSGWKQARQTLVPAPLRDRLISPMIRHWGLA